MYYDPRRIQNFLFGKNRTAGKRGEGGEGYLGSYDSARHKEK